MTNNFDTLSTLTGLMHATFVGGIKDNVRRMSATSQFFQELPQDQYRLEGTQMTFAVKLRFKTGGIATDGKLPDFVPLDAVQGYITPVRRYITIEVDNMMLKRAAQPGAFASLEDWVFDQMWDAVESMESRHAIGASSGLVNKVSSRTNSTTIVVKDGYGNAGTDPLAHLSEGSIIAWWDVSASAIGGAARISTITPSTNTIVIDSASTWEPDSGVTVAANDLIYFATTNSEANSNFISERGLAPNGLGTLLDPTAAVTTVHNISESTYPRWKPFRITSVTPDHMEVQEYFLRHGSKRGTSVNASTDVVVTYPAVVAQIARSLMGVQMQAYTGTDLLGGYSGVTVKGIPLVEDPFFYHNVLATLPKDGLYRITLGEQMGLWSGDGSEWQRLVQYDGKNAFAPDYMQFLATHRGAMGAITGITVDSNLGSFSPTPDY